MNIEDAKTRNVCHECIGEQFLKRVVNEEGTLGRCCYCGKTQITLVLEDLADRIHRALQEHFELTPDHPSEPDEYVRLAMHGIWERSGEEVEYLIADIAGLDEQIARDVTSVLSDIHAYQAVRGGAENPYDFEAMYKERQPNDGQFRLTWNEYCHEIGSHSRFFGSDAERMLDRIFDNLSAQRTHTDQQVVREFGPDSKGRFVWRARQAQSRGELETILKSPDREIGPPPSRTAKAGRMNAHGVSVFYGALDGDTCLAEVRALVGSSVVLARFELLRTVRLLDFDALAELDERGSYFDPDYAEHLSRAAFFKWLVREISRPVMPQDEVVEYIPTQAMAEYLANVDSRLDGIIFRSSQTGETGRNVMLFNHACGVDPNSHHLSMDSWVYVPSRNHDNDDTDSHIVVFGTANSEQTQVDADFKVSRGPIHISEDGTIGGRHAAKDCEETGPYGKPTLRLDLGSVVVLDIKRIKYDSACMPVRWDIGRSPTVDSEF